MKRWCLILLLASGPLLASPAVRVKDLTDVDGVFSNDLHGIGLVVGLQGTGDGTQSTFTTRAIANLLREQGIQLDPSAIRVKNTATVAVNAKLPPFARPGQKIEVTISSIGDAKSLQGGTLIHTPLTSGLDRRPWAVASGSVTIGGAFLGGGGGNTVTQNHPTAGTLPGGAMVLRPAPLENDLDQEVRLLLRDPDFTTAHRIARSINGYFGEVVATARDSGLVRVDYPASLRGDTVGFLARIQALEVRPDRAVRIVVNERTGTIVMGQNVRISTVAISHGNLTIEVETTPQVSQPEPFSDGRTVVAPQQGVWATEGPEVAGVLDEGISVGELLDALKNIGATNRDMISILQAMKTAGALHAELVIR